MNKMLKEKEVVTVVRDIEGIMIPSGKKIKLLTGYQLFVHQAKGGSYTLIMNSTLIRIQYNDVDAIGKQKEILPIHLWKSSKKPFSMELIWEQMKTCFDPEIPVNIVDLGLIYNIQMDECSNVIVDMTLTNMGCGMGPFIQDEIKDKLSMIDNINNIQINLVFVPAWNPDFISDIGKLDLGLL